MSLHFKETIKKIFEYMQHSSDLKGSINVMTKNILFILLYCVANYSYGTNSLQVKNPEHFQGHYGSIKETELTFQPLGAYIQCEMFLSFSPGEYLEYYPNQQNDQLEVIYKFELPEKAIVTESWLWFNNQIIVGEIKDLREAVTTFEGQVNRRKDPSVLFKRSTTEYELRVFPLLSSADSYRKVKITYLLPVNWTSNKVSIDLSTDFLSSYNTIDTIKLKMFHDSEWQNPLLNLTSEIANEQGLDLHSGNFTQVSLTSQTMGPNFHISYDNPIPDGVFINRYRAGDDWGYYSLAVIPSLALGKNISRDFMIIIDYESQNTSKTELEIINEIKNSLKASLNNNDRFNITIGEGNTPKYANWIQATPTSIEVAFNTIDPEDINNASLLNLFSISGSFINNSSSSLANILCFSNSSEYNSIQSTEAFINSYDTTINMTEINIVDFDKVKSGDFYWKDDINYVGNNLLYKELTEATGGTHSELLSSGFTLPVSVAKIVSSLDNLIGEVTVETDIESFTDYTFEELELDQGEIIYDQAILRTGKYKGENTIYVIVTETIADQPFPNVSLIPTINTISDIEKDSLVKKMWAGEKIRQLSIGLDEDDNETRGKIYTLSESERIISPITAFLALEPQDQDTIVCLHCEDEQTVSTTNTEKGNYDISLHPNPSENFIHLNFYDKEFKPSMLKIYDSNGVLVHSEKITDTSNNLKVNLQFLKSGLYTIKLFDQEKVSELKFSKI